MSNPVIGCLFFCLLIISLTAGIYFEQVEWFGFFGLGSGLLIVFVFRKKGN